MLLLYAPVNHGARFNFLVESKRFREMPSVKNGNCNEKKRTSRWEAENLPPQQRAHTEGAAAAPSGARSARGGVEDLKRTPPWRRARSRGSY
jgi:hypothetical protein